MCERALLDEGDRVDPALRAKFHSRLSWMTDELAASATHAEAALSLLDPEQEPAQYAFALLNAAHSRFLLGKGADGEAIERGHALQERAHGWEFSTLPANWAKYMDRFATARERFQRYLDRSIAEGDDSSIAQISCQLAEVECWVGNMDRAEELVGTAEEYAHETEQSTFEVAALCVRSLIHIYRGDLGPGRSVAETALALAGNDPWLSSYALSRLGLNALCEGRPEEADEHLTLATEMLDRLGMREPAPFRFQADHVEAVIGLGDLERAAALVARVEERAQTVPRPWILAVTCRSRALLAGARGALAEAKEQLEQALRHHERLDMPLELGRTVLVLGQVQRRANERRAAKETLERAVEVFDGLGARVWADRARAEMGRLGLRRAHDESLTPTEERVAEKVASGLTNREVADALFMSPKTVEGNLARIYRKLGIRSRAELGRVMAERPERHSSQP
jgi:ATP/maltotriose-dependent transcriptional regulator MalT